jgi:hypothetical protein
MFHNGLEYIGGFFDFWFGFLVMILCFFFLFFPLSDNLPAAQHQWSDGRKYERLLAYIQSFPLCFIIGRGKNLGIGTLVFLLGPGFFSQLYSTWLFLFLFLFLFLSFPFLFFLISKKRVDKRREFSFWFVIYCI